MLKLFKNNLLTIALRTLFFRILSIFNTYKGRDENVFFKETYNDIYSKRPNFWINNIGFEPFKLTLIFS